MKKKIWGAILLGLAITGPTAYGTKDNLVASAGLNSASNAKQTGTGSADNKAVKSKSKSKSWNEGWYDGYVWFREHDRGEATGRIKKTIKLKYESKEWDDYCNAGSKTSTDYRSGVDLASSNGFPWIHYKKKQCENKN